MKARDMRRAGLALLFFHASLASAAESETRPSAFDLQVGIRGMNRNFHCRDTAADLDPSQGYPPLVPFNQPLAPVIFVEGHLYPLAFFRSDFLAHWALAASYELGSSTQVRFASGTSFQADFATQYQQYFLGLRGRLPLGAHELGLTGGYGAQSYEIQGDDAKPILPDVDYRFIRLMLDTELRFDQWRLGGGAGTRILLSTGQLQASWFEHVQGVSIEANVFLGYEVASGLEVRVSGEFVQYGFDFNPINPATDPWVSPVAGGATDRYLSGSLALRYRLPEVTAGQ